MTHSRITRFDSAFASAMRGIRSAYVLVLRAWVILLMMAFWKSRLAASMASDTEGYVASAQGIFSACQQGKARSSGRKERLTVSFGPRAAVYPERVVDHPGTRVLLGEHGVVTRKLDPRSLPSEPHACLHLIVRERSLPNSRLPISAHA